MDSYITLSFLNDFIFCPRSIYFHQLYGSFAEAVYKQTPQYKGTAAHETIDEQTYSTSAHILQGMEVFSEQYNICGKIDIFDIKTGRLTERKREIKTIYDGYVFQVYAQCFALREMGYTVSEIVIHDLVHNKNYPILLPEQDEKMFTKFQLLIEDIDSFDMETTAFTPEKAKCTTCIYNQLCDASLC
ncbi:MAG: type V CRISPR-associated protein Cas4 [Bacteroidetes bacterium]|nr:type V CRISPR-associated protein Cas4 [Bacteroidota bacterium]MBS1740360.1 type V CRISPR-associated protein Cas4 [Bacteroidota bacterium]